MCPRWALALRLVLSDVAVAVALATSVCAARCAARSTLPLRCSVLIAAVTTGVPVLTTRPPLKRSCPEEAGEETDEADGDSVSDDGSELSNFSDDGKGRGRAYGRQCYQCCQFEAAAAETEWRAGGRCGGGSRKTCKCGQCTDCTKSP